MCDKNLAFEAAAWGPLAWQYLHIVAMAYPPNPSSKDVQKYTQFLYSFADTLPCADCSTSFRALLKKKLKPRLHLKNCKELSRFVFNLHNDVNRKIGKRVIPWKKYDTVLRYYLTMTMPGASTKIILEKEPEYK